MIESVKCPLEREWDEGYTAIYENLFPSVRMRKGKEGREGGGGGEESTNSSQRSDDEQLAQEMNNKERLNFYRF